MMCSIFTKVTLLASIVQCSLLWDGRFNDLSTSSDLNKWSWSNQVGPYQYYIHGNGPVSEYVNLGSSYKNPTDSGSRQGAKITLTNTAYWNGQNMRRTELIPQTSAAINKGKVFYHFSLMRQDTNAPAATREHQIAFFESHFTELKSGQLSGASGTSDPLLRWCVSGQTKWSTNWDAGVWHNVAYEIDFSAGTVGFWHSTGGDPLTRIVAPVSVSTSSNGADWHVGVLELPRSGYADTTEDFYFSGVYIESDSITTNVSGPGSGSTSPPPSSSLSSISRSTTTSALSTTSFISMQTTTSTNLPPVMTTSSPSTGGAQHYQQCGGMGYGGPSFCNAPYTCSTLNPYYAQCL